MEINKHICIDEDIAPDLVDLLKSRGFKPNFGGGYVIDIYESDPLWKEIRPYDESNKVVCVSNTIFTKKELRNASWLRIRSKWHNGYPQPESGFGYQKTTYDINSGCSHCEMNMKQKDSFYLKSEPKWGTRHLFMLNWVADELFCDEKVMRVFEKENVTGVSFYPVKNKKGDKIFENVYQLRIENVLDPGFILDQNTYDSIVTCPECNSKLYHPNGIGIKQFEADIFKNAPDIIKSFEWFGWGKGVSRLILINQKVYRILTENSLDRSLEFQVVGLTQ